MKIMEIWVNQDEQGHEQIAMNKGLACHYCRRETGPDSPCPRQRGRRAAAADQNSELRSFSLMVEPKAGPPLRYEVRNSMGYPLSLCGTIPRSANLRAAQRVSGGEIAVRPGGAAGGKRRRGGGGGSPPSSGTTVSTVSALISSRLKMFGVGRGKGTLFSRNSLGEARACNKESIYASCSTKKLRRRP